MSPTFVDADRALLSDPQTSGGLLVACSADSAAEVMAIFRSQGFDDAAIIGQVADGHGLEIY